MRARLVDAAALRYAQGGWGGLSYGTLAADTGLRKATLFHYFPTKDALVHAVFERLAHQLEACTEAWFQPSTESFAARLDRIVAEFVDLYGAEPVNARIVCQGLLGVERLLPDGAGLPVFERLVGELVAFMEQGIAAGAFVPARPLGLIMAIGGVVLFEAMVPTEAQRTFAGRSGVETALAARRGEVVAFVRRAVLRTDTPVPAPKRSR